MTHANAHALVLHPDSGTGERVRRALQARGIANVQVHHDVTAAEAAIADLRPDLVIAAIGQNGDGSTPPAVGLMRSVVENGAKAAGLLIVDPAVDPRPRSPRNHTYRTLVAEAHLGPERIAEEALDHLERQRLRDAPPATAAPRGSRLLLGGSAAIHAAVEELSALAGYDVPVLITGETGTGKELAARLLHQNSERASERFVPVNCTALSESLLEAELFGYRKGSFTGATQDQEGFLAHADRGTLFLDEVGDASAAFQPLLLRVIQERTYRPVGARAEERCTARFVAATHRDLNSMVQDGTFREDLFHRLSIGTVHLPPLRERIEDIELLSTHFLKKIAAASGRDEACVLAPAALDRLLAYHWPGNVRELENTLWQATIHAAAEGVIAPRNLKLRHGPPGKAAPTSPAANGPASPPETGFVTLEEHTRQYVRRVLNAVGNNKAGAVRILAISRGKLNRILAKSP